MSNLVKKDFHSFGYHYIGYETLTGVRVGLWTGTSTFTTRNLRKLLFESGYTKSIVSISRDHLFNHYRIMYHNGLSTKENIKHIEELY